MQALKKKAVTSVLWVSSAKFLGQFISWVFTILVIRILTPDDYGLMAVVMVVFGLINIVNEILFKTYLNPFISLIIFFILTIVG